MSPKPPQHGPPPTALPPLTQPSKKTGKPYLRFQDVEAEILAALGADPSEWDVRRFESETLVHLIRAYWHRPDADQIIGRLVDPLGRRIAVIVGDNSKGFSKLVREDILERIRTRILALLFADVPSLGSEFLEVSFKTAVKRCTLNEVERRKDATECQFTPTSEDDNADGSELIEDKSSGPDEIIAWKDAKEKLPEALNAIQNPKHREAVVLRHIHGWPIGNEKDPTEGTLCGHFAPTTSRQIHNWLKGGLTKLREALGEQS